MELQELRNLVKLKAWDRLAKTAKAQVETRTNKVMLNACEGLDATLEQEFEKGECAGIRLFMELPEVRIDEIENLLKMKENEDG